MKTTFVVLAIMVACTYAAPAPGEKVLQKAEQDMITSVKGEAPMEEPKVITKGEQNTIEESGEVWIPFWDFFSSFFKDEPKPETNVIKSTKPEPRPRPNRANFDDSGEFLEAENVYHFGESEEVQELVNVDSDEIRRSPHKAPEHVKDAILYGKVLPRQEDFSDYGDFLEATNRHMMGSPVVHKKPQPKVKSTWNSWFGKW